MKINGGIACDLDDHVSRRELLFHYLSARTLDSRQNLLLIVLVNGPHTHPAERMERNDTLPDPHPDRSRQKPTERLSDSLMPALAPGSAFAGLAPEFANFHAILQLVTNPVMLHGFTRFQFGHMNLQ